MGALGGGCGGASTGQVQGVRRAAPTGSAGGRDVEMRDAEAGRGGRATAVGRCGVAREWVLDVASLGFPGDPKERRSGCGGGGSVELRAWRWTCGF